MMVRLALQNRARPVQLLGEDQAHHDVREGELRKGQLRVLAGIDGLGETVRAADDKRDMADTLQRQRVHFFRQFRTGDLFSLQVKQQDRKSTRLNSSHD